MKKIQTIKELAKKNPHLTLKQISIIYDAFVKEFKISMMNRETIDLEDFGKFIPSIHNPMIVKDHLTGKDKLVKGGTFFRFYFKELIRKILGENEKREN